MRISSLRSLFPATLLLALLLGGCTTGPAITATQPATVYIVRHAEKADGSDPALTAIGRRRAEQLAELLGGKDVRQVFSTDTLRTRSTARPLAERLGLAVELYDHREPQKLAEAVRIGGGSALIVGHSNTIAELAAAFGAEPGGPVSDDEYDRLYVIRLTDPVSSEIRRYGD